MTKFTLIDCGGGNPPIELCKEHGKGCLHRRFSINEDYDRVKCKDCGEFINPMRALFVLASEESRLKELISRNSEKIEELKERNRCKCEKCGEMTRIIK